MRLSSLTLAAVLLLASVSFAQHSTSSAPPASPTPSPAPSPAPPPAPSPAPASTSASSSAAASATVSHSGAPSAPAPASVSASHIAPAVSSPSSSVSGSRSVELNSARNAPGAHAPDAGRVVPEQKVSDDGRIVPALRIGEKPPTKERVEKPAEPSLRRPICNSQPCKEAARKPEPPESDLRRPVCLKGPCPCPQGQVAGTGGCVVTQDYNQCQPGELWNGTSCFPSAAQCAGVNAMLQTEIAQLRTVRVQVRYACSQNSSSTECEDAKMREQAALQGYRILLDGADPACRVGWSEDPQ
jgi:hypothetical protein